MKSFGLLLLVILVCFSFACNSSTSTTQPTPTTEVKAMPAKPEARPAEVGVGIQGQSLENEKGIGKMIAQPALTLFRAKEEIVFEVQIPSLLEIFRASEGRYPESHEEFMKKIIKENKVVLPKLPTGQIYMYNVEEHQLWVQPE
jgi:hypothetical protein